MTKKYWLVSLVESPRVLEISMEEYEKAADALKHIDILREVESLFAIVAESAIEVEKFLLLETLNELTGQSDDGGDWITLRDKFNLKLLAFFTSIRAYRDQRKGLLKRVLSKADCEKIEVSFKRIEKDSIEFRVVEGLRDYAQHRRLPLDGMIFQHTNEFEDETRKSDSLSRGRVVISPYLQITAILAAIDQQRDQKFADLKNIPQPELDLRYFLRVYISKLAEGHLFIREVTQKLADTASENLEELMRGFVEKFPYTKSSGLDLFLSHAEEPWTYQTYIGYGTVRDLKSARKRWARLNTFSRMYVSSQLVADKERSFGSNRSIWIAD